MSTHYGKIGINGLCFDDIPSRISKLTQDYGVVVDTLPTFNSSKATIGASRANDGVTYIHKLRTPAQAFTLQWDSSLVKVSQPMYKQLKKLYDTQADFWIQMDDEMSRSYGLCTLAGHEFTDPLSDKVYVTPTYPVYPLGHEGTDPIDWTGALFINNKPTDVAFSVNSLFGLVVIPGTGYNFTERTDVKLRYTWRCFVRIRNFNLVVEKFAQRYYTGSIEVEQVFVDTYPTCTWTNHTDE